MRYVSRAIRRIFFYLAKLDNFKDDYKTVSVAQSKNLQLSPQNVHNEPLLWLHLGHNHKINFNEPGKEITVVTRWAWERP